MSAPAPARELEHALGALEQRLAAGEPPTVDLADAILVPAGGLLLEGSLEGLERTFEHLAMLVADHAESWVGAVDAALARAVERHLAGLAAGDVGPEALIAGRTAIEARFVVVDALGGAVEPELRERVEASDPELERRLGG
jgi:hypothetical protein